MSFSRKHFLSAAAVGVSAAALAESTSPAGAAVERAPVHFHILTQSEYDHAAMMQTLTVASDHKQVFQSVSPDIIAPGIASLYIHMQNALNAYQFSLGLGNLSVLGVLIGPSIAFALNDAMWTKYNFATAFGKDNPLASTNVYYTASSNLDLSAKPDDPNGIYQDWSAQAVLKRGGKFFVCHNATTGIASLIAMARKLDPQAVIADFEKNLLPGFQMIPAGVAAVQQAQENGWKLYPII